MSVGLWPERASCACGVSVCLGPLQKLFQNVYEHLKTFARPQGRALERVVHSMLHALLLKMQGSAFAYANAPYKKGVHVCSPLHTLTAQHVRSTPHTPWRTMGPGGPCRCCASNTSCHSLTASCHASTPNFSCAAGTN